MNREDIIRMAREAGLGGSVHYNSIERFAALVAAAEREACDTACAQVYYQHIGPQFGEVRYGIAAAKAAIRARGN